MHDNDVDTYMFVSKVRGICIPPRLSQARLADRYCCMWVSEHTFVRDRVCVRVRVRVRVSVRCVRAGDVSLASTQGTIRHQNLPPKYPLQDWRGVPLYIPISFSISLFRFVSFLNSGEIHTHVCTRACLFLLIHILYCQVCLDILKSAWTPAWTLGENTITHLPAHIHTHAHAHTHTQTRAHTHKHTHSCAELCLRSVLHYKFSAFFRLCGVLVTLFFLL